MKFLTGLLLAIPLLGGDALRAQVKDISGTWQGTLGAPQPRRIVLKVTKPHGGLNAVMYNIDVNGRPIAIASIALRGSAVRYSADSIGLIYAGTLNPEGNTIFGSETEGGQTAPLNLERVSEESAWAIPPVDNLMAADARPKFEVLTVKPHDPNVTGMTALTTEGRHVIAVNEPVASIVEYAYGVGDKQIVGAPAWVGEQKFDLDGTADVAGLPSSDQRRMMFQDALATRFNLAFHREQRDLAVYDLTVASGQPNLTVSAEADGFRRSMSVAKQGERFTNVTMKQFCEYINFLGRPLVDHTGLTGRYDFLLSWTPDSSGREAGSASAVGDPDAPPSFFTALKEQLGLKAEPKREPVDVIVVDRVEQPSAN